MIKRDNTHFNIEVPLPEEIRLKGGSRRANVHGVRVRVSSWGELGRARFRHTFNNGTARPYPEGLELAVETWMRDWGYAGMNLHEYLMRMFPRKKESNRHGAQ